MEGEGRGAGIPHIAALDGARGLAVAAVLLFHSGHLLGGYLGVDFFFTLSGFLITSLLLAESSRTGRVGLGHFWARRARRLLPALAVLLAGVAVYSWLVAAPDQLGQIRGDALATLGYVANWHEIVSRQSYFALFTAPSPLNHTWSLAIEEQFYVIWPLAFVALLVRFKRSTPKAVLVTALVLAGLSSVLMVALYRAANVSRVYFGTDTRAAAILFGAALAAWFTIYGHVKARDARIALELLGVAGAVVLAIAWTRLDGQSSTLYRGGFLVCALGATAIIAAAVHPDPGPISRLLSVRPLRGLGLISYGVYLYHWPIDVFLDRQRAGFGGWRLIGIQTALTLAIAIASYFVIEQPIRHGALSAVHLRALTPAIAVALVLAIVVSTNGATGFSSAVARDPLAAASDAYRNAPPGSERLMIVGNSVAALLGKSLGEIHIKRNLAVFDAGVPGCGFPPQVPVVLPKTIDNTKTYVASPPCGPDWETGAIARFRPDVVLWVAPDFFGVGGNYHGRRIRPCSQTYESLYRGSLEREVTRLGASGARVVVATQAYLRTNGVATTDRAIDCENRIIRSVATSKGAQVIDLFQYVCPRGHCRVKQDGVVLRVDGLHYEGAGGRIIAKWIIDQIP